MRRAKSVHFTVPGAPLRIVDIDIPEPKPGELIVQTEFAGVCGSDVHRLAGDLPFSGDPVCFGHEGTGFVAAVGEGAGRDRAGTPLEVGDRVYWFPVPLCGDCDPCRDKLSVSFCESFVWPIPAERVNGATFQEIATLTPGVPVYRIPEGTTSEAVIAFGCAMPTAIGGFLRLGEVRGDVVVQGVGPLGLAAIVLAAQAGARVIAIGDPSHRLDMARRLGADETIALSSGSAEARRARVLQLTGGRGAGIVIEAAGHLAAFNEGLELLAPYGRYLVMGLYSGRSTTSLNPVSINNRNLTIIGSLGYPEEALARTVALAGEVGERLRFAELVTHRFLIEQTEEAIATASRGEAIKAVVTPSPRNI